MPAPFLSVPRRNDKLTDIEKNPRKIRKWLGRLEADNENSAQQILTVLYAQNRVNMPAKQRLRNLEAFDVILHNIATTLSGSLRNISIPLSNHDQDTLTLLERIYTELAYGYKLILLEISGEESGARKIRLIAAIKAMKNLVNKLFYRHHGFAPESPVIWRDLNSIYRIMGGTADHKATSPDLSMVLDQEFQTALLIQLAQNAGLPPARHADTFELLRRWPVNHPKIKWLTNDEKHNKVAKVESDPFMLALQSSTGPMRIWSAVTGETSETVRFFNAQPALAALRQLISSLNKGSTVPLLDTLENKPDNTRQLLETLITCWGKPPARKDHRRKSVGSVFVCAGLSCLHSLLSRQTNRQISAAELEYPHLSRWQILNESEGGMGIAHNQALPHTFQPGELVGLMSPGSAHWQIGAVRWMKNGKRYQMGIQTLGDSVSAATLSQRNKSAPMTLYPALLAAKKGHPGKISGIFVDQADAGSRKDQLYLHYQDKVTLLHRPHIVSTSSFRQIIPRNPQAETGQGSTGFRDG